MATNYNQPNWKDPNLKAFEMPSLATVLNVNGAVLAVFSWFCELTAVAAPAEVVAVSSSVFEEDDTLRFSGADKKPNFPVRDNKFYGVATSNNSS